MALPERLQGRLRLPLIAAPMFLVSGPELVLAACKAGIVGGLPALNARTTEEFSQWMDELHGALSASSTSGVLAVNVPTPVLSTGGKKWAKK